MNEMVKAKKTITAERMKCLLAKFRGGIKEEVYITDFARKSFVHLALM